MKPEMLLMTLVFFAVAMAINFLPTVIAKSKRHHKWLTIFIWNLVMMGAVVVDMAIGMDSDKIASPLTFVNTAAWTVLLVWACRKPKLVSKLPKPVPGPVPSLTDYVSAR